LVCKYILLLMSILFRRFNAFSSPALIVAVLGVSSSAPLNGHTMRA
jgi:hypothetical protein